MPNQTYGYIVAQDFPSDEITVHTKPYSLVTHNGLNYPPHRQLSPAGYMNWYAENNLDTIPLYTGTPIGENNLKVILNELARTQMVYEEAICRYADMIRAQNDFGGLIDEKFGEERRTRVYNYMMNTQNMVSWLNTSLINILTNSNGDAKTFIELPITASYNHLYLEIYDAENDLTYTTYVNTALLMSNMQVVSPNGPFDKIRIYNLPKGTRIYDYLGQWYTVE